MHSLTLTAVAAQTSMTETLLGLLPFVLFLFIVYFAFRRQLKSPVAKLQKEYLERQMEQMPRIEALLERIAKALERNHQG
jgi:hypothetical protein